MNSKWDSGAFISLDFDDMEETIELIRDFGTWGWNFGFFTVSLAVSESFSEFGVFELFRVYELSVLFFFSFKSSGFSTNESFFFTRTSFSLANSLRIA